MMAATLRPLARERIGRTLDISRLHRPIYACVWIELACVWAVAGVAAATVRTSRIATAAHRRPRVLGDMVPSGSFGVPREHR
jgi:hypothetical protein